MLDVDGGPALEELRGWTREVLGLSFDSDAGEAFRARVGDFCSRHELSVEQLLPMVRTGGPLSAQLADALSVHHTYFFRERSTFDAIGTVFLPSLRAERSVRIWSAATSGGDEAYSLGITALEALGPFGVSIRVLGTDLSDRELRLAERGSYAPARLTELSESELARWFHPEPSGSFRVCSALRELCTFRRLNLAQAGYPFSLPFHLVFLRNVLYYFDEERAATVLAAVREALIPGGWLCTSLTEPLGKEPAGFKRIAPAIYRRLP